MTHDIVAMTGDQLIEALGSEFDQWRSPESD